MMLTIADYHETCNDIYPQPLSSYLDKFKNLFLYELVELKDSRIINLLIKWLQNLLNSNFKDSTRSVDFSDEKLYQQYGYDSHDYTWQITRIPKILGEMGDIRAVPILITALQDNTLFQKYSFSRVYIAKALGQLKDKRATVPLIKALKNDWSEARKAVAWTLG